MAVIKTTTFFKNTWPYMVTMINYIPRTHLEKKPSFCDYCRALGNVALVEIFDEAVEELVKFRNQHVFIVTSYDLQSSSNG